MMATVFLGLGVKCQSALAALVIKLWNDDVVFFVVAVPKREAHIVSLLEAIIQRQWTDMGDPRYISVFVYLGLE